MKKIIIFSVGLVLAISGKTQHYMTAGGLRMGTDWGFTLQQRLLKKSTGEFIFQSSLQREELLLTTLFEQHYPLITKGFNVYSGGGPHFGWLDEKSKDKTYDNPIGITLIIGTEFTLGRFNFSYDFKPAFNIKGGEKSFYTQTGVSIRYVILKNKVYKDMVKTKKKKKRREEREKRREERGKEWWEIWKKKN